MNKPQIIMIDQPDLVKEVTATMYKGANGHLWANEQTARRQSCTHDYCSCGEVKSHFVTLCDRCRAKESEEIWRSRPPNDPAWSKFENLPQHLQIRQFPS